jgi:hypothetical protein
MQVRIGVHVGSVIGGFVGIQPPRFDFFGAAMSRVRMLETRGKKRRLHASQEVIDAASQYGRPSDDFEASDANGMIFSSWRALREGFNSSHSELPLVVQENVHESYAFVEERALLLCTYLARFGEIQREKATQGFETREALLRQNLAKAAVNEQPRTTARVAEFDRSNDDDDLEAMMRFSNNSVDDLRNLSDEGEELVQEAPLLDDHVLKIEQPGDEFALYRFSLLYMRFDDPKVEKQYINRLLNSELSREVYFLFALMSFYILLADVANACMESTLDRLRPVLICVVLLIHIAYLHYVGTAHGKNFYGVIITYSLMAWTAALMYQASCNRIDENIAGSNIIAMYFNQLAIGPSFSLEVLMPIRTIVLFANTAQFVLAIVVVKYGYGSDVMVWDGLPPTFIAAYLFTSFFADFTLRKGFQSTMRRKALMSNRTEHAQQVADALETMLPAFVIDRLLKAAKKGHVVDIPSAHGTTDTSSQHSASSGASGATKLSAISALSMGSSNSSARGRITTGDVAQAMLMRRSETVWAFPRAVVMFVSFEPPVITYDTISDTVTRIEAVARSRSMQKVKTIGKTVVLVAGIDKGERFQHVAINSVDAALEIQRKVFPNPLQRDGSTASASTAAPSSAPSSARKAFPSTCTATSSTSRAT